VIPIAPAGLVLQYGVDQNLSTLAGLTSLATEQATHASEHAIWRGQRSANSAPQDPGVQGFAH
jgi:hypothetical protein